jgi:SAM-dependent methyltransferase
VDYLPGVDVDAYLHGISRAHPRLASVVDLCPTALAEASRWFTHNEFDRDGNGGRGDSYRAAQRETSARTTGIRDLFRLAGCDDEGRFATAHATGRLIVDVLGGDGLLARTRSQHRPTPSQEAVITGDVSANMVAAALAAGLPAVRQPAQRLLIRSSVADAVIMAYGTHHIPVCERDGALAEATRVLRSGGRVVVHDFETDSPMARWFADVVHHRSLAGHDYVHLTRDGLRDLLGAAGLKDVRVADLYDPFTIERSTEEGARSALANYVAQMYGLTAALDHERDRRGWLHKALERYFDVTVTSRGGRSVAVLARHALVGVGVKP